MRAAQRASPPTVRDVSHPALWPLLGPGLFSGDSSSYFRDAKIEWHKQLTAIRRYKGQITQRQLLFLKAYRLPLSPPPPHHHRAGSGLGVNCWKTCSPHMSWCQTFDPCCHLPFHLFLKRQTHNFRQLEWISNTASNTSTPCVNSRSLYSYQTRGFLCPDHFLLHAAVSCDWPKCSQCQLTPHDHVLLPFPETQTNSRDFNPTHSTEDSDEH